MNLHVTFFPFVNMEIEVILHCYSLDNHSLFTKMWTPNNKVCLQAMKLGRPPRRDENFIQTHTRKNGVPTEQAKPIIVRLCC
jgi:hypothetical protein